jgi:hypothetical protein
LSLIAAFARGRFSLGFFFEWKEGEHMSEIPRTLDGGLVLRRSAARDLDSLAEFHARIQSDTDEPDLGVAAWTRDLLCGSHPTFHADDFTVVEEAKSGKIVSSMNLISQTWTYAGIPFKMGRPELVSTDPEFRNRGLVRLQFEVIHEWSKQRGELVQGITGIPFYYRQFGYEMALDLGGYHTGFEAHVPKLEKDAEEKYLIRPAVEADLPFITEVYQPGSQRSLMAAVWDQEMFRYELEGKSEQNVNRLSLHLIEARNEKPVGFLALDDHRGETQVCQRYELVQGTSWYHVTPAVIRYMWKVGSENAKKAGKELKAFSFSLEQNHPALEAARERLPRVRPPYAWYLRLPDLSGFLRLVAPALERRLAASPCLDYTGELKLGFYRGGLHLKFEEGRLASVEDWMPKPKDYGIAAFPGLTFLQLLFGYRSLEELLSAFPDCYAWDDVKPVLRALFPKQPSNVWMVS